MATFWCILAVTVPAAICYCTYLEYKYRDEE